MSDQTKTEDMAGVMRRIAKLLAIAEDGRGDPNEAAAAARMAESIMRKYQIEHADIIETELKRGDAASFGSEDVGTSLDPEARSTEASGWSGILAVAVAELHDCQARFVRTQKHGKTIRFSGYAADAAMCRFTYLYLVAQMVQSTKQFQKFGRTRSESTAFRRGFNSAVCSLLRDAADTKRREMQEASRSRDLVVIKSTAVESHFGEIKYVSGGSYRVGSANAHAQGYAQGSKVDVTRRGVSHSGGGSAFLGR